MNRDVWVWIEIADQGKARNVGLELLQPAGQLAKAQGSEVVAVILGNKLEEAIRQAACYGARQIHVMEDESLARYATETYTHALAALLREYAPSALLLGATLNGRDLGPRLACRLDTGLTADCTGLSYDKEEDLVLWTRPAMGGNLMAEIVCPRHRPQMGTVRPGVFKKQENANNKAVITRHPIPPVPHPPRGQLMEKIDLTADVRGDIAAAEVVVAGGRGLQSPAGADLLARLAQALGGAVGASRAAVEAGLLQHPQQVGQTGKSIAPKLYLACGISGAIQHRVGIAGAEKIVAINSDPDAPIFDIADYGIVGDFFEVAPEVIRILEEGGNR